MGIASFGLQVATTTVYAYASDCYKAQSAEISCLLNAFRFVFAATIPFYAVPLGEKLGFEYGWLLLAGVNVVFLLPMAGLRVYGVRLRALEWQAPPRAVEGDNI